MNIDTYIEHLAERKASHFGYPYHLGFTFSQYGYLLDHFVNNLGDPYIPSNYQLDSRAFEQAVIEYFARLWNFAREEYWGYVTSCGTEGNLAAILYGKIALGNPLVYYSADTHYSVGKACLAYSLDSVILPSKAWGEMDYEELRKRIDPNRSALIICNVSTTFRGAYDSARKILQAFEVAGVQRRHIFLHGDAALGGMILPFLDVESDYRINAEFDSVAVSGHKWIGMPIPCGILLTKRVYVEKMARKIEYLNSQDTTLSGSRNGLAAILLHQVLLDQTTEQDWKEKIQRSLENAHYLSQALHQGGVPVAPLNRYSTIVVFGRPDEQIVQQWQLACLGAEAHAVIMPHHSKSQIDEFVAHLVKFFQLVA